MHRNSPGIRNPEEYRTSFFLFRRQPGGFARQTGLVWAASGQIGGSAGVPRVDTAMTQHWVRLIIRSPTTLSEARRGQGQAGTFALLWAAKLPPPGSVSPLVLMIREADPLPGSIVISRLKPSRRFLRPGGPAQAIPVFYRPARQQEGKININPRAPSLSPPLSTQKDFPAAPPRDR